MGAPEASQSTLWWPGGNLCTKRFRVAFGLLTGFGRNVSKIAPWPALACHGMPGTPWHVWACRGMHWHALAIWLGHLAAHAMQRQRTYNNNNTKSYMTSHSHICLPVQQPLWWLPVAYGNAYGKAYGKSTVPHFCLRVFS